MPDVAVTPVGAPGIVLGVSELDAVDEFEFPTELIATTVKVYAVPFVSPVNTHEVLAVFTQLDGAETDGEDETVYPVIAEPPVEAGAVQETVTCALPTVPVTPVGAPATVAGVTAVEADDELDVPIEFKATTVNV